jgi:hypothetical protein
MTKPPASKGPGVLLSVQCSHRNRIIRRFFIGRGHSKNRMLSPLMSQGVFLDSLFPGLILRGAFIGSDPDSSHELPLGGDGQGEPTTSLRNGTAPLLCVYGCVYQPLSRQESAGVVRSTRGSIVTDLGQRVISKDESLELTLSHTCRSKAWAQAPSKVNSTESTRSITANLRPRRGYP